MSYTRTIIHKGYCIETRLLSYILFLFVVVVAAVLSSALVPASPTSGHTQGSFRIVAPPSEVHGKWRQIVGGLPSEGDTALLPSHFGGVQQCLFWFNIRRTPPTMPPTDDNVSYVAESDWVSIPSREQTAATSLHQSSYADSDAEGFDRTASGKGGGRNTETEATTRAYGMNGYRSWDFLLYLLAKYR